MASGCYVIQDLNSTFIWIVRKFEAMLSEVVKILSYINPCTLNVLVTRSQGAVLE